jgi:hypothetical protein
MFSFAQCSELPQILTFFHSLWAYSCDNLIPCHDKRSYTAFTTGETPQPQNPDKPLRLR